MIKVSELSGAWLDYWVARAEGVPAENLQIRQVQRTDKFHCVRVVFLFLHHLNEPEEKKIPVPTEAMPYSSNPALWAPLIEKYKLELWTDDTGSVWQAGCVMAGFRGTGTTPEEAICRAVVRAAFGEEVPEVTP